MNNRLTYHATAIQELLITVGWQGSVGDDQSIPPASPPPHLHLQVHPCPLHTIKGVVVLGGDHNLGSSQAFQVFQSLISSPRVVA